MSSTENSTSEMQMLSESESSRVFELIYAKYSPVIYGVVCKAVGSGERASALLQEIFIITWGKICEGEINVNNCFTCVLVLTREHISEFLKSNQTMVKATDGDELRNCIELILVKGYSLEDIANRLNLSRNEARQALRKALNKLKH